MQLITINITMLSLSLDSSYHLSLWKVQNLLILFYSLIVHWVKTRTKRKKNQFYSRRKTNLLNIDLSSFYRKKRYFLLFALLNKDDHTFSLLHFSWETKIFLYLALITPVEIKKGLFLFCWHFVDNFVLYGVEKYAQLIIYGFLVIT